MYTENSFVDKFYYGSDKIILDDYNRFAVCATTVTLLERWDKEDE